jgi:hypothetical protein
MNSNNFSDNKSKLLTSNENINKKYYEKNKTLNIFNNNNNFSLKKENNFEPKMKNFCINLNNYGLTTTKKPSNNYIIKDFNQSYKKNNLNLSSEKNPNFKFKYLQTTQKIY